MAENRLVIGLNAALLALDGTSPKVLCVQRKGGWGLPFGPFDPSRHRTFDIGLRDFVTVQTAVPLGYVEQLYTFGDMGREAPRAKMQDAAPTDRLVSVGYLALSSSPEAVSSENTAWHDWYTYFPWEDWRDGRPACLDEVILPLLTQWANTEDRQTRLNASFGAGDHLWEEERVLERYELMYEAGLVTEAANDGQIPASEAPLTGTGEPMTSDHRRILATAIGRLRGKLRYRPIVFQMVPDRFTLTDLQTAVETILGFDVHKQNFRRSLDSAALVEKTDELDASTGGRPAALYRLTPLALTRYAPGLTLPRLRP